MHRNQSIWQLILLLPILILASAAGGDGESQALARLRRVFHPSRKTAELATEREQALAAVRPYDSAKVAEALVQVYYHLEQEAAPLEERRRPLLAQGGGKKLLSSRLELRPIRHLQDGILDLIGGLSKPETTRVLLRYLVRSKTPLPVALKLAIAGRAGALAARDHKILTQATARAKSREDIVLLLRALARLGAGAQPAGTWIAARLEHRSALVREEAADCLALIAWPGSIVPLIARLEEDEGRPMIRAARALEILTRRKLGASAAAWRRWLAREGGPFVRGEEPLGGGESTVSAPPAGGYYFGIPQEGNSILYVYDDSLSMGNPLGRRRGGPKPPKGAKREKRIDRCRAELKQALAALRSDVRFNIIAYANRLFLFERELQRASPENIRRAQAWLDALKLKLGTNTHDALELAFDTAGRGTADRYYEPEVDTIFALSDGLPTIQNLGKAGLHPDDPSEILADVRRWNPLRRVTVHTIGLSMRRRGAREFMRRLAQDNSGIFKPFP